MSCMVENAAVKEVTVKETGCSQYFEIIIGSDHDVDDDFTEVSDNFICKIIAINSFWKIANPGDVDPSHQEKEYKTAETEMDEKFHSYDSKQINKNN